MNNNDDLGLDKVEGGELTKWPAEQAGKIKIVGVLKSYKNQPDSGKGEGHVYEVKTKNGIQAFFAPTLLHKKLSEIAIGNIVSIAFTHVSKTSTGNPLKHFDVAHGKPTEERLKAIGLELFDETVGGDDSSVE